MNILVNFTTPLIVFLLTLLFGFWLSRLGKPYNGVLFNFHKLIALGTVIVTSVQIYKMFSDFIPQVAIIMCLVFAGISILLLFASGAFMSIGKLDYAVMLSVHRIAPVVLSISIVLALFLM